MPDIDRDALRTAAENAHASCPDCRGSGHVLGPGGQEDVQDCPNAALHTALAAAEARAARAEGVIDRIEEEAKGPWGYRRKGAEADNAERVSRLWALIVDYRKEQNQ